MTKDKAEYSGELDSGLDIEFAEVADLLAIAAGLSTEDVVTEMVRAHFREVERNLEIPKPERAET